MIEILGNDSMSINRYSVEAVSNVLKELRVFTN